jgi:hypothetical protein
LVHSGTAVDFETVRKIDFPKGTDDTPDDEFEGSSLDGKWTVVNGQSASIDLMDDGTITGDAYYDMAARDKGLLVQPYNAQNFEIRQDYTLPDGSSIVAKITPCAQVSSNTNDEVEFGIALSDNDTGAQTNDYVAIYFEVQTDGWRIASKENGTTITAYGESTADEGFVNGRDVYLRIVREGLNYLCFLSLDGNAWVPVGETGTVSGAFTDVWIFAISSADPRGGGVLPVHSVHWIREGSDSVDPW